MLSRHYDAVVALDGSGDFGAIQQAIDAVPYGKTPHAIFVRRGVYHERLTIRRPHLTLIGEGRDSTVIRAAHRQWHVGREWRSHQYRGQPHRVCGCAGLLRARFDDRKQF